MKVTIIGAGIGGLTAGIALKQKGMSVKIYEAASEFKTMGAGIILGCNAMQVYRELGIMEQLQAKGNPLNRLSVTDHQLKNLSSISLDYFVQKYKLGNYAIHRADLHEVLIDQFDDGDIELGKRLHVLDKSNNSLEFEDGTQESYEILIGADGIHSKVRQGLFVEEGEIRSAGQMCWRGVLNFQLPSEFKDEFREAWGRSSRLGHGQINEHQVYWFALTNSDKTAESFKGSDWRKEFEDYDPLIKKLLADTPDSAVFTAPITDLKKLSKWYEKNVCLIGDAAHAMTPNMGQGAGQAIEDGLALARAMSNNLENVEQAFSEYQNYRYRKVQQIVNNSWRIGGIAQLNAPILIAIRNAMMRITPSSAGHKGLLKTFEI